MSRWKAGFDVTEQSCCIPRKARDTVYLVNREKLRPWVLLAIGLGLSMGREVAFTEFHKEIRSRREMKACGGKPEKED